MSRFIPNTRGEQSEMLKEAGFADYGALFADIPEAIRLKEPLSLPKAKSEPEVLAHMRELAAQNRTGLPCFLGAGAYDHYIPAVVRSLLSRQEFYTAYTPYQPEISQGTLQAIFEYQSMICGLTGMEVANASLYDGATALAEAAGVACAMKRRDEILVSAAVNPQFRAVIETYARFRGQIVKTIGCGDGRTDLNALQKLVTSKTAAVVLQTPNFYGSVEELKAAAELAHTHGALLVAACEPYSLALLESPGQLGADIAVGEGQPLGSPLNFGGPYLGFFAARREIMRKLPGRIVGLTSDRDGNRAFVLTLQAREQHIRREKATSNICSNEALNALAATITLSVLGREGLRVAASQCLQKAHYACDKLTATGMFTPAFHAPFFNEFTLRCKCDVSKLNERLLDCGVIGGFDLGAQDETARGLWLVAVTEKRTKAEIDYFAERAAKFE